MVVMSLRAHLTGGSLLACREASVACEVVLVAIDPFSFKARLLVHVRAVRPDKGRVVKLEQQRRAVLAKRDWQQRLCKPQQCLR